MRLLVLRCLRTDVDVQITGLHVSGRFLVFNRAMVVGDDPSKKLMGLVKALKGDRAKAIREGRPDDPNWASPPPRVRTLFLSKQPSCGNRIPCHFGWVIQA